MWAEFMEDRNGKEKEYVCEDFERSCMKTSECVCKTPEEYIRVALAIETLAYHDKNYLNSCLAKSDARISEEVQSLLIEALRLEGQKDG